MRLISKLYDLLKESAFYQLGKSGAVIWTQVDEFYNSQFVMHVVFCKECDPQDEPCEVGNQILEDWKTAKEREE